jgi:hypothetical protein
VARQAAISRRFASLREIGHCRSAKTFARDTNQFGRARNVALIPCTEWTDSYWTASRDPSRPRYPFHVLPHRPTQRAAVRESTCSFALSPDAFRRGRNKCGS